jgi:hypothetical protein
MRFKRSLGIVKSLLSTSDDSNGIGSAADHLLGSGQTDAAGPTGDEDVLAGQLYSEGITDVKGRFKCTVNSGDLANLHPSWEPCPIRRK